MDRKTKRKSVRRNYTQSALKLFEGNKKIFEYKGSDIFDCVNNGTKIINAKYNGEGYGGKKRKKRIRII